MVNLTTVSLKFLGSPVYLIIRLHLVIVCQYDITSLRWPQCLEPNHPLYLAILLSSEGWRLKLR
jgi:hypothetical protein